MSCILCMTEKMSRVQGGTIQKPLFKHTHISINTYPISMKQQTIMAVIMSEVTGLELALKNIEMNRKDISEYKSRNEVEFISPEMRKTLMTRR